MVLGILPVPGRRTNLDNSRAWPAGFWWVRVRVVSIFSLVSHFSLPSLALSRPNRD